MSDNAIPPFLRSPLEIQEMIFEHALKDQEADASAWGGSFFDEGRHEICLSTRYMRAPPLAQVCRQLRANFLPFFCHNAAFRLDLAPDNTSWSSLIPNAAHERRRALYGIRAKGTDEQRPLSQHDLTTSWLRHLSSSECGIRRLQVRLPGDELHGRRANLNFFLQSKGKRWLVELVPDSMFKSTLVQSRHRGDDMPPIQEIIRLSKFLEQNSNSEAGGIIGLDWHKVLQIVDMIESWTTLPATLMGGWWYLGFHRQIELGDPEGPPKLAVR